MDSDRDVILIVDDERFNLNVLTSLLEPDYDILIARNGAEALRRATCDTPPDLILLDIMMPDMDGYQVLQQLQANPTTQNTPVIFVTAMGETHDETRGLAMGAVDYITKPISPPILRARVKTHLTLRHAFKHQQESNRQLSKLNEELVALNQLKNVFLGIAAHDLRNPASAVRGLSELLLEEDLTPEDQQAFLTSIHRVSQQMLNLLNDLLDISAIESGGFYVKPTPNDLVALLRESVAALASHAQAKNTRLILDDTTPLPLIDFDKNRLSQVADNLITNAMKFSPPGSVVRLFCESSDDFVGFSVMDQGPGLSSQDRDLLFRPFQKLSATPTGGERSTGIGLFIVHQIVEAHAGVIRVENNPDGGCRFIVQLPRK